MDIPFRYLRHLKHLVAAEAESDRKRDLAILKNTKMILENQGIIRQNQEATNDNLIAIGRILIARNDNLDEALRTLTKLVETLVPGQASSLNLTMSVPVDNE